MSREILLEAQHLIKEFPVKSAMGVKKKSRVHAVSDVSLAIYKGETLGLVGESGCGKSTLGRVLIRLIEPTSGRLFFEGQSIENLKEKDMRAVRRKAQMIFQDPYSSLDPRMKVRDLIAEPLETHHVYPSREETTKRVQELMDLVGIRPELIDRYPHQFSGGQRQRIGIARALALKPELIICDEPVSALDVSIQSQILNLLKDLQQEMNLTYLFISHDLSVVHYIADRICVMFLGKICEIGDTDVVYERPLHPYTKFLLSAIPKTDPDQPMESKELLPGELPSPVDPPAGCRFHTRCPYADEACRTREPEGRMLDGRQVFCHHPLR
ncbi:MAG: dipeptide ABC transporter ATP-binding protein [Lachnospiraceae bacterium]|nr:dipeptide ABC transporter ATP-binding protein [Lachnospiraceae bacterium]